MITFAKDESSLFVCLFVCLSVSNFAQKLPNGFAWNFDGRLAMALWTNVWILVVTRITVWIQGLYSGFVTIGRHGKWLTDISLLLILIRQMAEPVRRALAEVCTVAVLLVLFNRGTLRQSTIRTCHRNFLCLSLCQIIVSKRLIVVLLNLDYFFISGQNRNSNQNETLVAEIPF